MISPSDECYVCKTKLQLEEHHVFFGSGRRKLSDQYGMVVVLCHTHHRGKKGPHLCRETDLMLKSKYQAIFEQTHTREEFQQIFGRSYL